MAAFDRVTRHALEKTSADRYASAGAMANEVCRAAAPSHDVATVFRAAREERILGISI